MNVVTLKYNEQLIWQSDWPGHEVGFHEVNIVGMYQLRDTNIYFYIDMETNAMIDAFTTEEE